MEKDVMSEVLKSFQDESVDEQAILCFGDSLIKGSKLSKELFKKIVQGPPSDQEIVFIDGGNASLLKSPSICVDFVRVFSSIYDGSRRISCSRDEFYVVARAKNVLGALVYEAELFKLHASIMPDSFFEKKFRFDPFEKGLKEGVERGSLERIPGMMRRLAELSTASHVLGTQKDKSVIVLDGDLSARLDSEKSILDDITFVSQKKQSVVCALSKTSSLIVSSGESVASLLQKNAPQGCWYYPLSESVVKSLMVKLHVSSRYIFKLDVLGSVTDINTCASFLMLHSTDPVFLGYPYGLVEADRFARVSNREADSLRVMLSAKAGKSWDSLSSLEKSFDAHGVLDKIS